MDRDSFIQKFNSLQTEDKLDKKSVMSTICRSIDSNLSDGNPRGHRNLIVVMEELSELSKEISKELRGKGDKFNITEELADVILGIFYVQEICGISDDMLCKAVNIKVDRLQSILDTSGRYR